MQTKEYMTIDGFPVEINGEKNLLELIRKAGIDLPTFCYHSELSIYGACRMCMVETGGGDLEAACSTPPRPGMSIRTNVERLRRYRKNILELLLANHCRDCTTCGRNRDCKLQTLADHFNIQGVRFPNTAGEPKIDNSSLCVTRDQNKCILCGDCVRMCNEVQDVGAIDFARRGAAMTVSAVFDRPIGESSCVGCGQCAAVCPTGAVTVKDNTKEVWKALDDRNTKVTVQIAPAVRVAVARALRLSETGNAPGSAAGAAGNAIGRLAAALRRMGFDEVYDTAAGADLTVLEEANELLRRLKNGGGGGRPMPLFTSCCPAWVRFAETRYPELLPHLSTCRSPMQMFARVIGIEASQTSSRTHVHVAVMPCTAKKYEAAREEFRTGNKADVNYVITTQELIRMIKQSGIVFSELAPEAVDMPFGTISGAGLIFGVTGGVTEAVLRRISDDKSPGALLSLGFQGLRGMEGTKTAALTVEGREIKVAVVSGLKNASALIGKIKGGEESFDFVEVMACPGGCIAGGGQPQAPGGEKESRGRGLYAADRLTGIKRSEENPLMMSLYQGILKGRVHELLHVDYSGKNREGVKDNA
ncbi:MAG: [FeFe] hydrogenase, group A [Treponema sp.]|jgi:NADH-quinone oxidoreductase subunit G|nr:[FeFe] hydrogenase, group A [Treponema sp.]